MKLLITGSGTLLGNTLVLRALKKKYKIIASYRKSFPKNLKKKDVSLIKIDLEKKIKPDCKIDCLIHCASAIPSDNLSDKKMMRINYIGFKELSLKLIANGCKKIIRENKLENGAYIRPIAFRGYGEIGLAPKDDHQIDVSIAAWEWGTYLGDDALKNGVEVCVSSWQRVAPNTIPTMAKAGGNYLSSTLISTEAKRLGFDEGIALSTDGKVSEGAGENLFMVKNDILFTPPASAGI